MQDTWVFQSFHLSLVRVAGNVKEALELREAWLPGTPPAVFGPEVPETADMGVHREICLQLFLGQEGSEWPDTPPG